jgi:hypothetical protein
VTAVVVLEAALAVGVLAIRDDLARRTVNLGCNVGPVNMDIDIDPTSTAFSFPYGKVTECEVLDKEAHLFGEVEATTYLLLDTDQGAVVVRVEYHDLEAGFNWSALAYELTADEAAARVTSEVDRRRVEAGIDSRGGARTEVWHLYSGI